MRCGPLPNYARTGRHRRSGCCDEWRRGPSILGAGRSVLPVVFGSRWRGRKRLARLRREELLRASRILGIRHNYFFDQKDTGLTFDLRDGFQAWDVDWIRQELFSLLEREKYDLVLVLLPTSDTHGHHQTVAQLTLQTVAGLKLEQRPAVLGARTVPAESRLPTEFPGLDGFPLTRTVVPEPVWSFDRRTPLYCHRELDYSIVVNWVIAEHKSQGIFQMEYGRRTREFFWLCNVSGEAGAARWRYFLQTLGDRQEEFAPSG